MKTLILLGLAATAVYASDAAHATGIPSDDSTAAIASETSNGYVPQDSWTDENGVVHTSGAGYAPPPYSNDNSYYREESYQQQGYDARTHDDRTRAPVRYDDRGRYDSSRSYRYDDRYSDAEMARMCDNDDGLGGAAIGGVVGGVLGNRIAGRGDRTVGTVVGAVAGAAVGGTIDRNADKNRCEDYQRRVAYEREYRDYYNRYYGQSGGRYDANRSYSDYGYGHQGYYTVPETHVTTEYVPYETVTTTTETEWEYVYPRTKKVLSKKRTRKPVLIMK